MKGKLLSQPGLSLVSTSTFFSQAVGFPLTSLGLWSGFGFPWIPSLKTARAGACCCPEWPALPRSITASGTATDAADVKGVLLRVTPPEFIGNGSFVCHCEVAFSSLVVALNCGSLLVPLLSRHLSDNGLRSHSTCTELLIYLGQLPARL